MNLGAALVSAFHRAPAGVRGTVKFTRKDGCTASAEAVGAPAKSMQAAVTADQFASSLEIIERHRRLSVLAKGLDFPPRPGMIAEWGVADGGSPQKWNVLSAAPVAADGKTVVLYRVTLKR